METLRDLWESESRWVGLLRSDSEELTGLAGYRRLECTGVRIEIIGGHWSVDLLGGPFLWRAAEDWGHLWGWGVWDRPLEGNLLVPVRWLSSTPIHFRDIVNAQNVAKEDLP